MSQKPVIIYGVPFSVHTRKVILAARIKSIAHESVSVVPVIPGQPPANWRSISPTGLIPAIDEDGFVLADSTAILLHWERTRPRPALLPENARDYANALFLDAWAGDALFRKGVHPLFHNLIVAPNIHKKSGDSAAIEAARQRALPEAFAYLESLRPTEFLLGDQLSIADLAVVSNLITLHYLGERIDESRYPRLHAYLRRRLESALVRETVANEAAAVAAVPGLRHDAACLA